MRRDADDATRIGLPDQGQRVTTGVRRRSLRLYLLLGILIPVGLLVSVNTISLYSQALNAINTAYDRTLLASTKSIGEQLDVTGYDAQATLLVTVSYAALEAFEADNQSRLFYRVSSLSGALVSGYPELPFWRGQISVKPAYAALVDFYDDTFEGTPVRVAVLMQPVASSTGRGMAVIQVAEAEKAIQEGRYQRANLGGQTVQVNSQHGRLSVGMADY